MLSNPNSDYFKVATGSYTGDDSANKAIAHGLLTLPTFVFIHNVSDDDVQGYIFKNDLDRLSFRDPVAGTGGGYAVTNLNSTNFYVGNAASYKNSCNQNTKSYYWYAVG